MTRPNRVLLIYFCVCPCPFRFVPLMWYGNVGDGVSKHCMWLLNFCEQVEVDEFILAVLKCHKQQGPEKRKGISNYLPLITFSVEYT